MKQRAGARVLEARDVLVGGLDARSWQALHLVGVFLKIGVAEQADRVLVALDLLDDQVVLLALVDIGAVRAQLGAELLVADPCRCP